MKWKTCVLSSASLLGSVGSLLFAQQASQTRLPNVIFIMADDLGIGDLGCYGQRIIRTPGIDKLAANGMRFAQHYSGSTVSAPSRCSLITGKHIGHAFIRGNKSVKTTEGDTFDYPLMDAEITVGEVMKQKNYVTACIGKWGLGGPDSEGHPNKQGFDYFFGYLGQGNAHNYYPSFMFENERKIDLWEKVYSHDLIMEKALTYIDQHSSEPFFLYLTPTIPHADLIVPENELGKYENMFNEKSFPGPWYRPQEKPRATFAAMVSRLDRDVQRIVDMVSTKGIAENTIIIFTSDNGTHSEGGHDPYTFDSNGPFRGMKRDLYEGGIRTPFIVQWPSKIKPGSVSYHVSAFWDFLPTLCQLVGGKIPSDINGISYLPELINRGKQKKHRYLYWEFHEQGGKQAILKDNWKLIKLQANQPEKTYWELYNLSSDPSERLNTVKQYPEKVENMKKLMKEAHFPSTVFPFGNEKNSNVL